MQEFKNNIYDESLKEKYESEYFKQAEKLFFSWEKIKISELQRRLEKVQDLESMNEFML